MHLSLIVAMTRSGIIGRGRQLPWKLSADLKHFKSLTMGHHLIMGRKTFESLGRVLPGRTSIVITHDQRKSLPVGVCIAHGLSEAVELAAGDSEPFVIGGGQIFAEAISRANRLYVTWVEVEVEGDVRFPAVDWSRWREVQSERRSADEKNEYDTTFCVYDRV